MFKSIAFAVSNTRTAKQAAGRFAPLFNNKLPLINKQNQAEIDVIVALGGDGFMLETLHQYASLHKPIFGLNRGTVGFLMNHYQKEDFITREALFYRLNKAQLVKLHPLEMVCTTTEGEQCALAINEVSLLRQTRQAAKLKISIDNVVRLAELVADGIILTTPAGSTAYNLSAHGPILPLGSNLLALTPLSPFRPRRWRGALLPHTAVVKIDILEPRKRPVSAVADFTEVRNIQSVTIRERQDIVLNLLFDSEHNLEERILKEQFLS